MMLFVHDDHDHFLGIILWRDGTQVDKGGEVIS